MLLRKLSLGAAVGVALLTGFALVSCGNSPAGPGTGTDDQGNFQGISDWHIAPGGSGEQNTAASKYFKIAGNSTNADGDNSGTGVMKVTFRSSDPWGITELYTSAVPTGVDWTKYDQIQFDYKCAYSEDYLVIARGNNDTNDEQQSWKNESYGYKGDGVSWQTYTQSIAGLTDPGWAPSGSNVDATAGDYFADAASGTGHDTFSQLNINPVLNLGDSESGEAVNQDIVIYIDNVRFHDSTGVNPDHVLYNFDKE